MWWGGVLFWAVYRPPGYIQSNCNSAILNSLKSAARANFDGILICGDFNHPAVSWTEEGSPFYDVHAVENAVSGQFVDCVQSLHLVQMVREPSFIGAQGF